MVSQEVLEDFLFQIWHKCPLGLRDELMGITGHFRDPDYLVVEVERSPYYTELGFDAQIP